MSTTNDFRYTIFPDRPLDDDDTADAQWQQLHFLFGQAMFRAQAYEDALARFVVAAEDRWQRSGLSEAKIWRLTLGPLQREYKRYCILQPNDESQMDEALRYRNSIAHNFYRRRLQTLGSTEGRDAVIAELIEMADRFRDLRDTVYQHLGMLECRLIV